MNTAIHELKVRAEILHKRIKSGDALALERFRVLPQARDPLTIQRQHCLAVVAVEAGFPTWPQAKGILSGEKNDHFGDLLCPKGAGGHINHWYKTYEEADSMRQTCNGYLLAYRRQYLVVDRFYIESLGLDPDDSDWAAMGFDWARPVDMTARTRLYAKLLSHG